MHTIRTPAYQSGDHTQLLQTGTSVYNKNTPNREVVPERILAPKGEVRC